MFVFLRFLKNQQKRLEVVPSAIEHDRSKEVEFKENIDKMQSILNNTTARSSSLTTNYSKAQQQNHLVSTTESVAASTIATLNSLHQPFVKIQNDLDEKISSIIVKLESLKDTEMTLTEALMTKNTGRASTLKNRPFESDSNSDRSQTAHFYDSVSNSVTKCHNKRSKSDADENESRLKYLERVQETQVRKKELLK